MKRPHERSAIEHADSRELAQLAVGFWIAVEQARRGAGAPCQQTGGPAPKHHHPASSARGRSGRQRQLLQLSQALLGSAEGQRDPLERREQGAEGWRQQTLGVQPALDQFRQRVLERLLARLSQAAQGQTGSVLLVRGGLLAKQNRREHFDPLRAGSSKRLLYRP